MGAEGYQPGITYFEMPEGGSDQTPVWSIGYGVHYGGGRHRIYGISSPGVILRSVKDCAREALHHVYINSTLKVYYIHRYMDVYN